MVDFGLNSISPFILTEDIITVENEIISATGFQWAPPTHGKIIDQIDGEDVYEHQLDGYIGISVGNPCKSYIYYQRVGDGFSYLQEMQTDPATRGQGWATKLILYVVKNRPRALMDKSLSKESASLIEKLIARKAVTAYRANLATGEMHPYNPDDITDQTRPMYDVIIAGINRPVLPHDEAKEITWVLEGWHPARSPLLQPHILRCPLFPTQGE